MPIFANQFGYAHAYDPVNLDTGTPSVGASLGKAKTTKTTPKEDTPASPSGAAGISGAAASEEASASNGLSKGNSSANGIAAGQGSLNGLSSMVRLNAGIANPTPETDAYNSSTDMFDRSSGDTPKEATVNTPSQASHSLAAGGFWGGLGHDISSGFDTARHGVSASTDWMVSGGMGSSPNNQGSAKTYAPRGSTDSGVTTPSNVWNPSQYTNTPGSNPSRIAGVSTPAISSNPSYNEQQFGRVQGARNAAQNSMDESGGFWNNVGDEAENWLSKLTSPEQVGVASDAGD